MIADKENEDAKKIRKKSQMKSKWARGNSKIKELQKYKKSRQRRRNEINELYKGYKLIIRVVNNR